MKKLGLFILLCLFSFNVFAYELQLNIDSWSQEKKNMIIAMSVGILHANGFTYDKPIRIDNTLTVNTTPSDPSAVLTQQAISDRYDIWRANMDVKIAAAQAIEDAKEAEIAVNDLANVTFAQIDNYINTNVTDLASAKEVLRKIVKYMKAKEL